MKHIYDPDFKYVPQKQMSEDYLHKKFKRIQAELRKQQAAEQTRRTFKQITQDLQEKHDEQRQLVNRELRRIA